MLLRRFYQYCRKISLTFSGMLLSRVLAFWFVLPVTATLVAIAAVQHWLPFDRLTPDSIEPSAPVFVCLMHPQIREAQAGVCPICGMPLTPQRGVPGQASNSLPLSFAPTINAEVVASAPPAAGKTIDAILKLSKKDGTPVTFADLEVAHTKRIHLLIINEALNDYAHEHPAETAVPGFFSFHFEPRYGGHYVVWADLLPTATGRQEYARADLWVAGPSGQLNERLNRSTAVNHYWFDLSTVNDRPFIAGQVTSVQVTVSDPQGRPISTLEPLMGAFAHGVGFTSDLSSVLHVHPLGAAAVSEKERGGPVLNFNIVPRQPGFMKFYVQVQLNGQNVFAGFGLHVLSVAEAKDLSRSKTIAAAPSCD